ncbi:Inositol-1-monophosphatase [Sedimentisphaera cyanobacteriorum]|uniref:Inositol-1-monophosphatase n=1 Tax=Sedimentisphaera cyanobacteriorum TaxID=1940790 RepID=A0A1Q2HSD6_9BACT|nr:inositol monophosphatase [Sedimentisphaera cyanobacteriorum]AQQ10155.1 Inositol-1-monophosphatase [Sedimentisphaera cyanobacteriorum]
MYSKDVKIAKKAATLAGDKALSELANIKTSFKNGSEVVTQADPLCQQIIIDEIKKHCPEDGIVAEEGEKGKVLVLPPQGSQRWWIIDPIDGTNNYSKKIMLFSVSIALFEDSMPVAGVVYCPGSGEMFEASLNGGMFLNGIRSFCSEDQIKPQSMVAIDSAWPNGIPEGIIELCKSCKLRNFGSTALHLAYVASGSMNACIVNKNRIWDFAAGAMLIQEAGGKITYQDGTDITPLNPQAASEKNFELTASNNVVHNIVLDALIS